MKLPAFEIIGSREGAVAIMERCRNAKKAAAGIMKRHMNVRSVLMKASARKGAYRKRSYRLVAGRKETEVIHAESGCRFLVDPQKAYFSPREQTERMRIAEKVKENESVAVFFAGIGPFAIVIAKKAMPKRVLGIEANPAAARYFQENVRINKVGGVVEVVRGNVRKAAGKYRKSFGRIIMPLPESARDYLKEAEICAKHGAVVHYYCFCRESEIADEKRLIKSRMRRRIRFLQAQKVLPWGPGIHKTRIDFRIC